MIVSIPKEKFLKKIFSKNFKMRSFLLVGPKEEREDLENLMVSFLKCEEKSFCKKCPSCKAGALFDFYIYDTPALSMEEAKNIREKFSRSSFENIKIFLIKSASISPEAQSTLLKIIEEPYENSYFILSVKSADELLAPLLSRFFIFRLPISKTTEDAFIMKKFSKNILKSELEEAAKLSKERQAAEKFLSAMEFWAEEKIAETGLKNARALTSFIEDLFETKKRLNQKTYFTKALLEHLVISKAYLK